MQEECGKNKNQLYLEEQSTVLTHAEDWHRATTGRDGYSPPSSSSSQRLTTQSCAAAAHCHPYGVTAGCFAQHDNINAEEAATSLARSAHVQSSCLQLPVLQMLQGRTFLVRTQGQISRRCTDGGKSRVLPFPATPSALLPCSSWGTSCLGRAAEQGPCSGLKGLFYGAKQSWRRLLIRLPSFHCRPVITTQEHADQHSQPVPALPPAREWAHSAPQIPSSALHSEVISLIGCCTSTLNSSCLAPSRSASSALSPAVRGATSTPNSSPLLLFPS